MRKNILNVLILIISLYFIYELLTSKLLVINGVNKAIIIWRDNLFPTLLPIFIISEILINYDIGLYLGNFLYKPLTYLFRINNKSVLILILSIISGFPSGAKNIRTLYDNKDISKEEAEKLLTFTHYSNPIFILTTLSLFFLNNERLGFIILICHYLSGLITGLIFRNYNKLITENIITENSIKPFTRIFLDAIAHTVNTLFLILGIVTSFLIISEILINALPLNIYYQSILKGILEVTQGLESLKYLNLNNQELVLLSSAYLSFGGLSIHMQVISCLNGTDISYIPFLQGRIIHTSLSIILGYILYFSLF